MNKRIDFLVKDPHWTCISWQIDIAQFEMPPGQKPVLRVYDITDIIFNGKNAHTSFDIENIKNTDHWYLYLPLSNRNYCVEFGFQTVDGLFIALARSNTLYLPPDRPPDIPGDTIWSNIDV